MAARGSRAEGAAAGRQLGAAGGNLTGVNFYNAQLTAKRLEALHALVPESRCHEADIRRARSRSGLEGVVDIVDLRGHIHQ